MDTIEDPLLAMTAETLLDFERVRIAAQNRLRQLTRSEADVDGRERGFGLTAEHPTVMATQKLVDGMVAVEHQAELHLAKLMRDHPLGPWMKAQPGIGMKQGARLLASIGDPYIRPDRRRDGVIVPARPRTVSELWAYCGMHVIDIDIPGDHTPTDAQVSCVAGEPTGGDPDHRSRGTHPASAGVAPSRRRGQRSNWNADARMRVYLVAAQTVQMLRKPCFVPDGASWATHVDGCRCGRWRVLYDAAKEKYSTAMHKLPCPRCGPAGKPAPIGSPLSDGHRHARAVRIVAKTILKELWREAGRLHGADTSPPDGGQ